MYLGRIMSEILESLRNQGEYVEEHLYPLSCKLKRSQQAAVEAVIKLAGNKTNAVRLLIDLGWEALEKDGVFDDVIQAKLDIEEALFFSEENS
jgi:hypothetical protein